ATARCRAEGPTFRAAKCAHLGASAQGRLRGPSDRHHAARPGDSKSQETAQRDLREAYWPVAAEGRRGAGARFFYDGRDGQGFRLSRQGNRSSAGDATACSRVLNGHASGYPPGWRFSPSIRERCEWLPATGRSVEWRQKPKEASDVRFGSNSRHRSASAQCPLYPQKRTLELSLRMSALCQKQTLNGFTRATRRHELVVPMALQFLESWQ